MAISKRIRKPRTVEQRAAQQERDRNRIRTPAQLEALKRARIVWLAENRERLREKRAAHYLAHRETLLARQKAWDAGHPERGKKPLTPEQRKQKRLYCAAWRLAHPEYERMRPKKPRTAEQREAARLFQAAWRLAHPQECRAYSATYRLAHLEEERAYSAAHPEGRAARKQRRRARKLNAPVNDFTAAQWRELQAACDHRCAYCGKRAKGHLTQDHLTPLIDGGSHTLANILPACKSCNCRKHTGPVLAPVQPLLLTLAPSKPGRKVA